MPGSICQQSVVALTVTQDIFTPDEPLIQMILCPAFFNEANFRQDLSASPSSEEYLGNWKFAAGTFVHELWHIFGETCKFGPDRRLQILTIKAETLTHLSVNDKRFYINGDQNAGLRDPYGPEVIYALANKPGDFTPQYGTIDVLTVSSA